MGKECDRTRVTIVVPGTEEDRVATELFKESAIYRRRKEGRQRSAKTGRANEEKQQRAKEDKAVALKLAKQLLQNPIQGNAPLTRRVRNKWPPDKKRPSLRTIQRYLAK